MKVKVLPLPSWVYNGYYEPELFDNYKDGDVIFNRDGWYYDRISKVSWIEFTRNGKIYAKVKSPDQFLFTLKIENHIPLSKKEVDAILTIWYLQESKKLRELYETDCYWKQRRTMVREIKRDLITFFREYKH